MAIKEKEVWVNISNNLKYYENIGYKIPKYADKQGRVKIKRGTKILVKIKDLPPTCKVTVTRICDVCNSEKEVYYGSLIHTRNNNNNELDYCNKCKGLKTGKTQSLANEKNCIAYTHPEFAKLFWNVNDTLIRTHRSNIKTDFKCDNCGEKIENKIINKIYTNGLSCICKDKISYPEKFMFSVLNQLNVNFEFQKTFEWSNKKYNTLLKNTKRYDFFLKEVNLIIETHGRQHSGNGFESLGGRTLEEEKENDKIKQHLAKKNNMKYIVIDCKNSELNYIKKEIKKSELKKIFNLENIDWNLAHEFACKSLVKEACKLFNEGKNSKEISKILLLDRSTIIKYLKQGNVIGWCMYNAKEEMKKNGKERGKEKRKQIVQLSLKDNSIKIWDYSREIAEQFGISQTHVSRICRKKKEYNGFLWMYLEDYISKDISIC